VSDSYPKRDIDLLLDRLVATYPDMNFRQLSVRHPADDDGLWFVSVPGKAEMLQIESTNGTCPMLIEIDTGPHSSDARNANTVEQAFQIVRQILDPMIRAD
jgi:hypothetical protein